MITSMKLVAHRLGAATRVDSPNQDARPAGAVNLILLHGISLPPGRFGGNEVVQLFTNTLDTSLPGYPEMFADLEGAKVSSHLFIRRDGGMIQFVPFDRRAWHAGESAFKGRANCNDFSIGIELEGTDDLPYMDAQYERLTRVCALLMEAYPITDVCGHCDVAPGRKTDPGPAFDWDKLRQNLVLPAGGKVNGGSAGSAGSGI